MSPLFDRRDRRIEPDAQRPAHSRLPDLAAEFARPAPAGPWTVHTEADPWRIVDGRGVVQLLCDKQAAVRATDGVPLLRLAPDLAGRWRPLLADGLMRGVVSAALDAALGTDTTTTNNSPYSRGGPPEADWIIKDPAALRIARVTASMQATYMDLLPGGPLNDKVIANRLSPQLATHIRTLGPLSYAITGGGPTAGTGQLSGPAGQPIAIDRFAYGPPVKRAGTLRRDLVSWTIHISDNPFPAPWLLALLRSTKTLI